MLFREGRYYQAMTSTSGGGSAPDVSDERLDTIFDVVAHPHRRFLLARLGAGDGPLSVPEAAAAIAAWEDGGAEPADARAVEVGLYHAHLPKLAEAGLVEYDAAAGTVSRGERAPEAERHLDADDAREHLGAGRAGRGADGVGR